MKLENHMNVPDVLAAFDRATVEAVFTSLNGKREKELTPQQRAGLTKRRNNELKRQAQVTIPPGHKIAVPALPPNEEIA